MNLKNVDICKLKKLIEYLKEVPSSQYDYYSIDAGNNQPKCILAHAYVAGIADEQTAGGSFVKLNMAAKSLGFESYGDFVFQLKKVIKWLPFVSFIYWKGALGKWSAIVALKLVIKKHKRVQWLKLVG